jgi:hypothetical protein
MMKIDVRGILVVALFTAACGGGSTPRKTTNGNNPPDDTPDAATPQGMGGTGGAPMPKPLVRGSACSTGTQCQSGSCVDGFCCETACRDACYTCKLPGSEGKCLPVPAGEDPDNECADDGPSTCKHDGTCDGKGGCRNYAAGTACMPGACTGTTESSGRLCDGSGVCQAGTSQTCPTACMNGSCNRTCSDQNPCQTGFFCDTAGMCKVKVAQGMACTTNSQCTTNFCADGVCCGSACGQLCSSCNLPGSVGTCTAVPDGQDPKTECAAEAPSTCGRAGGCNGMGACRVHPAGTACGGQTCMGATQQGAKTCNGTGSCVAGTDVDCSPFRCGGGSQCRTTCQTTNDCDLGYVCMGGSCTGDGGAGLVLRWRFDEPDGTAAVDTSGNKYNGTYTGMGSFPTPSTAVPPDIGTANPRSRQFTRATRQAVQLTDMPVDLTPPNEVTVAAWYRATSLDTSGAELVSAGNSYVIRLRPTQIEFAKRVSTGLGTTQFVQCLATVPGHLNGSWHHVAAVTSPSDGMKLYVDGLEVRSEPQLTQDILYDQGKDFWVGRHGNGQTTWDFQGNIDDVRVYNRALSPDDIATLAGGGSHPPEIIVHWRFDEVSGAVAVDDSGNGHNGAYTGTNGMPAPSNLVPLVSFDDPRSRRFTRANRHAVQFQNMTTDMQPPNNVTLSAWYRATSVDTAGAELVSGGNSYLVRLLPTRIQFSKRYTNVAGNGATAVLETPDLPGNAHLDGKWHHVAATSNGAGMKIYFDGTERNTNVRGEEIRYDQARDLWVGRHGNNQTTYDFEGNIDEVTIFGRALAAAEISDLAQQQGNPGQELVLDWSFDESSGTTALDSSPGMANNGTYLGGPTPQAEVPPVPFPDPRSRHFTRGATRQAVQIANMPDSLQPANDLTVSAWYRSSGIGAGNMGEEIVSAGDNYLLRLRATQVEFAKRTSAGGAIQRCLTTITGATHLDGAWHHLAATTATDGIRIYLDGVAKTCPTTGTGGDIVYAGGTDFFVGRHGNGQTTWDFEGNIDEVRIYRRALQAAEIAELARRTSSTSNAILHWTFDEATGGTMALDTSGNNFTGLYTGVTGTPAFDADVPPLGFVNTASRKFDRAGRQAVQLAPIPPLLVRSNDLTVSVWYKATDVDTAGPGADLVSAGDSYLLRLAPNQINFTKRIMGGGGGAFVTCPSAGVPATTFLDGQWHHLVAVTAPTGMTLYFDGASVCTNNTAAAGANLLYDRGPDFWVGRHGNGEDRWDFSGKVDDVRVYPAALSAADVTALFQGGP